MLHLGAEASEIAEISSGGNNGLRRHTNLSELKPERELDRVAFSRSREVEIKWDEIISDDSADGTPYIKGLGVEYIRKYMESLWGYPNGPQSDAEAKLIDKNFSYSADPPLVILTVPDSKRLFYFIVSYNNEFELPVSPPIFQNLSEYERFWRYVETVNSSNGDPIEMSVVDLAPAIIYRQYRELRALERLGDALAANAEKIAAREFSEFPSAAELDELTAGYTRMRSVKTDIDVKLERLRDRARDLGYYLALSKETITLPDGSKDELEEGQIYQPYLTNFAWQAISYRRYLVREYSWFSSSSWVLQVPYATPRSKVITRYQKVIPDFDPWSEKEHELSSAGFSVYRFDRIGQRYITAQGQGIEEIAERCDLDVDFAKRCAVMIPVYEQSLISGEILSRYIVIKRPRRGVEPVHLPRLFIEEELLFATHFHKVEVGELVESINLAPGEQREIVIEKTTLTEQESRRTATSISDLTETDRVDLSSEMEREATSSREQTTTSSLSARAGGSYGPFSGSAEGATSASQTTKQFARDLQRVANKASRSVTRQTRQEVKTSSSIKTNVTTRESTKITITNINDGRSLNLLFYQLYNIYRISLRLERMSFTVLSGREVIAGSGIVLPHVYKLSQLGSALSEMFLDFLPVSPNPDLYSASDKERRAREAYQIKIVGYIKETLKEYMATDGRDDSSKTVEISDWDPPNSSDPVEKHVEALAKALNSIRYIGNPVDLPGTVQTENSLVVGSPGLYLDAFVGVRPGTEPYSEEMRRVELDKRLAEVNEINSRAAYQQALASRLSRVSPSNSVLGRAQSLRDLELTFEEPPLQGAWSLYVSDAFVCLFEIASEGISHKISFTSDQSWLSESKMELAKIVHREVGQELYFLI
ncbi:hypothetical protein CLBKND_03188 [Methylorubrum aminovorans]